MTALPGAVSLMPARRGLTPGSLLRLLAVPLWTAACYGCVLVARLGPGGWARRDRLVRRWARQLVAILRIDVATDGEPPRAPFLLVTNHLSYLDVIVLASRVDCIFVAKDEVSRWPLFGRAAKAIGCLFVDRESPRDAIRVGRAMRTAHALGRGVVLFAEGTSSEGSTVLPLRSPLLQWPAADQLPVHTATLAYYTDRRDPPAGLALCWWGDMTFLPHLAGVCRLGPSQAHIRFGGSTVSAGDRKALAGALHAALLREFTPSGGR